MNEDVETKKLRELIERPEKCEFWGQPYTITPRLIAHKCGDGQKLRCITPMATRPSYFVARIDSSINDPRDPLPVDHQVSLLEEIMEAAADEYRCFEEGANEPLPVADWTVGAAWSAPFLVAEWKPTQRSKPRRRSGATTRTSNKRTGK